MFLLQRRLCGIDGLTDTAELNRREKQKKITMQVSLNYVIIYSSSCPFKGNFQGLPVK